MNAGANLQEQTSSKDASDVEYTLENGSPYPHPYQYQRIGSDGPLLLQDTHLIELFGSFDRERIPERVVHARGAGAHGYFEVTNADFCKNFTMMDMLSENGLKTPITARFSTVGGESGSADEARDPRGFALKFRTRKGVLDIVMNNTPVFFIRDPAKFPHFIHTQKRHPASHLRDKDMFWDYLGSNPESLYQVMRLFSDLGTPQGFRHMDGWTGHTYRWVQNDGTWSYVRLYAQTMQGVQNFTNAEAASISGTNPDFATQDLYESIQNGTFPGWTMFAQVLSPEAAQSFKYNVLDLTKDWGFDNVAPVEIGKFYLTQNPANYFAEIEQAAFSPANMVEGWAPSADPVLQARLFSYPDAHRYRLGVNHKQIPVNAPVNPVANFERDGHMNINGNQGSRPNYLSTLDKIKLPPRAYVDETHQQWTGGAVASLSAVTEIDFDWPRIFWNGLSEQDQQNLISNVVGHLGAAPTYSVRQRMASLFNYANSTLGQAIADGVGVKVVNLTFPNGPTWFNVTKDPVGSTLDY
ncbi:catalase-domain-containing protein [Trametes versicolor FP-101664 SS1]|uniref:catalase-domain-containing protein n=1 Tax=Trametes versicolor (strain FP-101664) TaxID=717944 RepID=UPI0004622125|nr:catalase-domain-containing protein [Trametes versicolor FP-101664 SS1]EIW53214.1 catalase-domain-containing protein [Trametes versicolor FP-101664 SS1]